MTLLLDPPAWVAFPMVLFASWRLAVFLVLEGGPGGIVRWSRERMGIQHADDGTAISWPDRFPGSAFTCVWCLSLWTTLVVYGILWVAPGVVMVLGTWGVATYLEAMRTAMLDRR